MANPNPSPATRFKPGNKAGEGKRGARYKQIDRFHKFMGELPDGLTPWERIQQITESDNCPPDLVIKGKAKLGDWLIKDTDINLEIHSEKATIVDLDSRILDMLKTPKEIEEELEEGEEANEQDSQG